MLLISVQSSSPKELTPVPVVHVSAVPPESLTAVSEENQVQGVVINSMAEFPDLLAGQYIYYSFLVGHTFTCYNYVSQMLQTVVFLPTYMMLHVQWVM